MGRHGGRDTLIAHYRKTANKLIKEISDVIIRQYLQTKKSE